MRSQLNLIPGLNTNSRLFPVSSCLAGKCTVVKRINQKINMENLEDIHEEEFFLFFYFLRIKKASLRISFRGTDLSRLVIL